MTDPWANPPARPDPGYDGQWADLSFLDDQKLDPEISELVEFVFADMADLPPPYGSPERAAYDRRQAQPAATSPYSDRRFT